MKRAAKLLLRFSYYEKIKYVWSAVLAKLCRYFTKYYYEKLQSVLGCQEMSFPVQIVNEVINNTISTVFKTSCQIFVKKYIIFHK